MMVKFEGDQLRNMVGFHLPVGQLHFVSLVHHFSSFSVVTIDLMQQLIPSMKLMALFPDLSVCLCKVAIHLREML